MQPDTPNFDFLAQLYGTVDGSPVPAPTSESGQTEAASTTESTGFGGGRRLRRLRPAAARPVPNSVVEAFDNVDQLLDSGTGVKGVTGWRKLHETNYGEVYEIDAGDGFTIQIHMLKYIPDEA
jgi:hypothetical protein